MDFIMRFEPVSLNASILYFKDSISTEILNQVQQTFHLIREIAGIVDITPSYTSLLIEYDTALHSHLSLEKMINPAEHKKLPMIIATVISMLILCRICSMPPGWRDRRRSPLLVE